ncbi:probable pectinesterase/pectinesterase inhibitor 58 [Cucurbita maxima]|uniref:Pectinesterase n=1 Tax=Cucurbita maxima TaxID=3661 RepID=A0A6J1I870_CUCMA|nr:probable pectinesterase/pectinesterase inhibitor 58 [Cucurbita maxima]
MAYDRGGCKDNKAALVGLLSLFLVALVNGVNGAGEDHGSSNADIKTLYCTISGTVDFIFGNAAVVLQNCKILVRKPKPKQPCPITAQGRMESDEPTGIVLQNCTISSDPDYYPVRHTSKSYLGRPWKQYSRTVVMQSQIDDLIQPEGWLPWNGDFALNTLYYTEFDNRGPGAAKENRVKWKGIKQITAKEAINFTPSLFIHGDSWIKNTGISYTGALMKI